MNRRLTIFYLFLVTLPFAGIKAQAQIDTTRLHRVERLNDTTAVVYYAPRWYEAITNIPGDYANAGKILWNRKSIAPVAVIAGSTVALYLLDQHLVDGVQQFSRYIGMDATSDFNDLITIGDLKLMEYPGNLNTAFYFIGEGWVSILLFSGIGIHGAFTHNPKELRIFTQFIEGYIELGVISQLLKRSFGRETPRQASRARGRFRPFPAWGEYQRHVPRYDAMPSGHMATMAFSVTLLADSYPDSRWIRPVGYSLIGLCSLSMMNNGVHWASDYPLGFGIGYLMAKAVMCRGRVLSRVLPADNALSNLRLSPTIMFDGSVGMSLSLKW